MADAPRVRKSSKPPAAAADAKDKKVSRKKDEKPTGSTTTTTASAVDTHHLTLRSSARLITEFFEYSIHTVLFQRGVYPAEDFQPVKKYGLNMLVSSDDQVRAYVKRLMGQVSKWMGVGKVKQLVLVIVDKDDGDDVERWAFDVQIQGAASAASSKSKISSTSNSIRPAAGGDENAQPSAAQAQAAAAAANAEEAQPSEAEIQQQIQAIFRQITASVTFLPTLATACTFNVLVYADADSEVPLEWGDSEAREIEGGERVQLRSFGTGYHKVGAVVSYRVGE